MPLVPRTPGLTADTLQKPENASGSSEPAKEVVLPLSCRGIVLLGDDRPIVLCAVEGSQLFQDAPDHSRPCSPDGLTHRYSKMTASLGLDTHIHELRPPVDNRLHGTSSWRNLVTGRDKHTPAGWDVGP